MINLEELRHRVRHMTPDQEIYMVLKEELTRLGHWKALPRGNPKKGYEKSKTALRK